MVIRRSRDRGGSPRGDFGVLGRKSVERIRSMSVARPPSTEIRRNSSHAARCSVSCGLRRCSCVVGDALEYRRDLCDRYDKSQIVLRRAAASPGYRCSADRSQPPSGRSPCRPRALRAQARCRVRSTLASLRAPRTPSPRRAAVSGPESVQRSSMRSRLALGLCRSVNRFVRHAPPFLLHVFVTHKPERPLNCFVNINYTMSGNYVSAGKTAIVNIALTSGLSVPKRLCLGNLKITANGSRRASSKTCKFAPFVLWEQLA